MSRRGDIRMHVEHLFEGRTLTKETIELKEEIYGNLVARYEDYVAQGMTDDEAFRRTCEAVGSLDDVLGGEGEKDEEPQDAAADQSDVPADKTVVAPGAPVPPEDAPGADEGASAPRRRWSNTKIAVVTVVAVLLVAIAVVTAINVLNASVALDAYDSSTSSSVQRTDADDSTTYVDPSETGQTTTTPQGEQNGNGQQGGNGQQNGSATGLDAEVYAHDVSELSGRSATSVGDGRISEIVAGLPLAAYATEVSEASDSNAVSITYTYQDRDRVATDDDCVDRAIVYNVAALLSTVSDLDRVEVVEVEQDDYDHDYDRHVFERVTVEGILGIPLNADLLTEDVWGATRDQVMTKRYWDPIWESADVD